MSDLTTKNQVADPKQSAKTVKSAKTKVGPLIYVGPTLGKGRLTQYALFRGGLPVTLDDLKDKYPQLTDLIVPVSDLSHTLKRIATPGTFEQVAYESIKRGGEVVG